MGPYRSCNRNDTNPHLVLWVLKHLGYHVPYRQSLDLPPNSIEPPGESHQLFDKQVDCTKVFHIVNKGAFLQQQIYNDCLQRFSCNKQQSGVVVRAY